MSGAEFGVAAGDGEGGAQLGPPALSRRDLLVHAGGFAACYSLASGCSATTTSDGDVMMNNVSKAQATYASGTYPATFVGGDTGTWKVERVLALSGAPLAPVAMLDIREGALAAPTGIWALRGVAGHARYVERPEKSRLDVASPPLGRPESTNAVLIPIRKSSAWWALPQDERRAIFEGRSHHIADSMKYLPRIARRLYHARDLGESFDFLTWFEFAPEHSQAFDDLVGMLRSREEWTFVEREVEIRLTR